MRYYVTLGPPGFSLPAPVYYSDRGGLILTLTHAVIPLTSSEPQLLERETKERIDVALYRLIL